MPYALVELLRMRSVDVRTAQDDGMVIKPDPEHLAWAASSGRALLTLNIADFGVCMPSTWHGTDRCCARPLSW